MKTELEKKNNWEFKHSFRGKKILVAATTDGASVTTVTSS